VKDFRGLEWAENRRWLDYEQR